MCKNIFQGLYIWDPESAGESKAKAFLQENPESAGESRICRRIPEIQKYKKYKLHVQEHISGPIYLRSYLCRRVENFTKMHEIHAFWEDFLSKTRKNTQKHAKTRFSRNQRKKLTPVRAAIFRVFKQRKYTEIHEKHAFSRNYSISRIFRRIQQQPRNIPFFGRIQNQKYFTKMHEFSWNFSHLYTIFTNFHAKKAQNHAKKAHFRFYFLQKWCVPLRN